MLCLPGVCRLAVVRRAAQSPIASAGGSTPLKCTAEDLDLCVTSHYSIRHARPGDVPNILEVDQACFPANLRTSEQSLQASSLPPTLPYPTSHTTSPPLLHSGADADVHRFLSPPVTIWRAPWRRRAGRFRHGLLHDHGGGGSAWRGSWVHIGLAFGRRASAAQCSGPPSGPATGHRPAPAERVAWELVRELFWKAPSVACAIWVVKNLSTHHLLVFLTVLAELVLPFWRSKLTTMRRSHSTSIWDFAMSPPADGITMVSMMLGLCIDHYKLFASCVFLKRPHCGPHAMQGEHHHD
jgi:hypothetical protein